MSKNTGPTSEFHHALRVQDELCTGCSHCMHACPTEAIRIRSGRVEINHARCIDCGECYRVCPVSAIKVEQDDLSDILRFTYRIALIPSVFMGLFRPTYTREIIFAALHEIGFTDIFEIERAVPLVMEAQEQWMASHQEDGPCISAFCPAIVRLIQVRFPGLTKKLMLVKPPVDLAALYCRKQLLDKGVQPEEIGLFYFTPCAAKIAAVKSPVGETSSLIQGVVNINSMYDRVRTILSRKNLVLPGIPIKYEIPKPGITWSLTHGEAEHTHGRALAIDGISHVSEFLDNLENEQVESIDFLELRACDQGCAGGILMSRNRFLVTEALRRKASQASVSEPFDPILKYKDYILNHSSLDVVPPRSSMALDQDMEKAMGKLNKARKLMCDLPGIDCGACGAPTCQALAEDIVQGKSHLSHCLFLQRVMEKNHTLDPEHSYRIIEEVWGKNRLDKDCNKKGAANESI